jgi:pyruvate formate lyase activating enzyme
MQPTYGRIYSFDEVREILDTNSPFIDAVVLTGGEPTLRAYELILLCRMIKEEYELDILLDTNGTKPWIIQQMLEENLVDRIALDVKTSLILTEYTDIAGLARYANPIFVYRTMVLAKKHGIELEVRTTMVPGQNTYEVQLGSMTKAVKTYATDWYLQQFQPENAYDPEYRRINRPSRSDMLKYAGMIRVSGYDGNLYIKTIEKGLEKMPQKVSDLLLLERLLQPKDIQYHQQ